MEEILDEIKGQSQESKIYSKLSLATSRVTLILFVLLFIQFPLSIEVNEKLPVAQRN